MVCFCMVDFIWKYPTIISHYNTDKVRSHNNLNIWQKELNNCTYYNVTCKADKVKWFEGV